MARAQAAVELLILLSVALIALIAIYGYSADSITDIRQERIINQLETAANDLKNASNDVFAQGIGAKKKVFYLLPSGVDANKSGIEGQSFVFHALDNDVVAKTNVNLQGSVPLGTGGHEVWVTAYENYVFVGTQNTEINKPISYVTLQKSSSVSDTIRITNNGEADAAVTLSLDWGHSSVTTALSIASFSLSAGTNRDVNIAYISAAGAAGNYTGKLNINSDFGTTEENYSIPLNAEIIITEINLIVIPSTWTASVASGSSINRDFNVCNISTGSLSNISFSASGEAGGYMQSVSSIGSLAAETCTSKNIVLNAAGATAGNHTGTVTVQDSLGSGSNADTIALDITIT